MPNVEKPPDTFFSAYALHSACLHGPGRPPDYTGDPCSHGLVGKQIAQIWAASVLIGIHPTTAPNEHLFVRSSRVPSVVFAGA
jgi:hypothetical protein